MNYSSPVCPGCGAHLKEINGSVKCEYCGRMIIFENNHQERISTNTTPATPVQITTELVSRPVNPKSGNITFLLWFFFGIFGVHRFYLNQKGLGILYLLTMGGFGIVWCIDFFLFMFGTFKDSRQIPISPINPAIKKVVAGFILFWFVMIIFAAIFEENIPKYLVPVAIGLAILIVNIRSIMRLLTPKNND